jgi:hypothetical protein
VKRFAAIVISALMPAWGADFAVLNIAIVEGEGTVYATGSRATRGITVQITDETGRPVPGVAVSFQLPDLGATGVFSSGARTEIVNTGEDGRATVWGMRWNRTPGDVQVRITAAKDGVRAGTVSTQHLSDHVAADASGPRIGGGHRSKLLIVGLIAAGAAAGGLAAGMARGGGSVPAAAPQASLSIGRPSVIIGAP